MLKKWVLTITLSFWGLVGFSQVSTLPHSIGIGQNTLSSIPFHIKKDGEVARFQGVSPYISFYEGANWNGFIQAFSTSLGIGTKNSRDMIFYVNDVPRINISGSTGFITTNSLLNAAGGLSLTNTLYAGSGSGVSGDVLYSSGEGGSPYWGTPPAPKYAVSANDNAGQTLTTGNNSAEFLLDFKTELFDDGNLLAGGVFTARHNGVYLVNIQIPMNYLDHYLKKGSIRVYKNSSTTPLDVVSYDNGVVQYDFSSGNYTSDRVVGVRRIILENIYKLNTNDILSFKMEVPAFQSITIRPKIFIYAVN